MEKSISFLSFAGSHVRTVVATLGGPQGAAQRADRWQHLYAGFTVWLSQTEAIGSSPCLFSDKLIFLVLVVLKVSTGLGEKKQILFVLTMNSIIVQLPITLSNNLR